MWDLREEKVYCFLIWWDESLVLGSQGIAKDPLVYRRAALCC